MAENPCLKLTERRTSFCNREVTTDRASFSAAIHSDIQSTSRLDHGNGHRIEYLTLWNQFDRIPQTALFRCLKSDLRAYKKEKAPSSALLD